MLEGRRAEIAVRYNWIERERACQSLIFPQGDSGGPLTVRNTDHQHVLIGAVSSGLRCGNKDQFGVYSRISYFRQWIDRNMKNPKFCQTGPDARD